MNAQTHSFQAGMNVALAYDPNRPGVVTDTVTWITDDMTDFEQVYVSFNGGASRPFDPCELVELCPACAAPELVTIPNEQALVCHGCGVLHEAA